MTDLKQIQEIDSIFSRFTEIFTGRQQELKKFLLKHSENLFKGEKVKHIEKIDSTDQIKITGYRNYISAWKTSKGNPIISLCLEEDGIQKRYDYIFYLSSKKSSKNTEIIEEPQEESTTEEKDPSSLIASDMEEYYDESIKFMHSFQFEQAILQLDSMIELLIEKNLEAYSKKLEEKRNYLKTAYGIYKKRREEFDYLDKKIADLTQDNIIMKDKGQFQEGIEKINQMIDSIKGKALPDYLKILEEKKKELEAAQEIYVQLTQESEVKEPINIISDNENENRLAELKNLERMIKINKEYNQYQAATVNIQKIISILKDMNRNDLVQRYEQDLLEIKEKIDLYL